jgi:Transcription factor S-II (TFIIS), central domain
VSFLVHSSSQIFRSMGVLTDDMRDLRAASEIILHRAQEIETTVHDSTAPSTAAYTKKMRSLYTNLKDKNNPRLRERVVSGELAVNVLCSMSVSVSRWSTLPPQQPLPLFFITDKSIVSSHEFCRIWRLKSERPKTRNLQLRTCSKRKGRNLC